MSGTARKRAESGAAVHARRDPWTTAFAVVESLKARLGRPAWLRGFRVQTSRTGEVEVEVQAVAGRPRAFLPARIGRVPVRVREFPALDEPHAGEAAAL